MTSRSHNNNIALTGKLFSTNCKMPLPNVYLNQSLNNSTFCGYASRFRQTKYLSSLKDRINPDNEDLIFKDTIKLYIEDHGEKPPSD